MSVSTFTNGEYFGGNKVSWSGSLGRRFSNHLTVYLSGNQNIISIPNKEKFSANVYALIIEGALNKKWFNKAIVQYDNFSEEVQLYFRINWIHTPGSDLFIVINNRYKLIDNSI